MNPVKICIVSVALLLVGGCAGGGMPIPGAGGMPSLAQITQATKSIQTASRDIGEPEEIEMGQGIAQSLLGAAPLVQNDRLQRYVNQVGRWLALQTERPDLPWTFGVINNENVNAFAAPGGMIFITNGLLKGLSNEAELAGVLAHEIAHVVQKHQLNAIKSGAGADLFKQGGLALADQKLGKSAGGQIVKASGLAEAGAELIKQGLFTKPLDRGLEYEADRMGVIIAARAGYDPYGLVTVLQMLQNAKGDNPMLALLFKTHPNPADRIEQLEKLASTLDAYQGGDQGRERFAAALGLKVEKAPPAKDPAKAKAPAKTTPQPAAKAGG